MSQRLWITGKYIGEDGRGNIVWGFGGVFDSEDGAIGDCRSDDMFVAPVVLNNSFPDETVTFERSWYPLLEEKPV